MGDWKFLLNIDVDQRWRANQIGSPPLVNINIQQEFPIRLALHLWSTSIFNRNFQSDWLSTFGQHQYSTGIFQSDWLSTFGQHQYSTGISNQIGSPPLVNINPQQEFPIRLALHLWSTSILNRNFQSDWLSTFGQHQSSTGISNQIGSPNLVNINPQQEFPIRLALHLWSTSIFNRNFQS